MVRNKQRISCLAAASFLVVINLIVFLFIERNPELFESMALRSDSLSNPAILLGYMFAHVSFLHLCINSLFLIAAGWLIGSSLHIIRFLICYIAGGLISALLFCILTNSISFPDITIAGSSAATCAVIGLACIVSPKKCSLDLFFFRFRISRWAILLGFLLLVSSGLSGDNLMGLWLHMLGLCIGVLMGIAYRRKICKITKNPIVAKIETSGFNSLSSAERFMFSTQELKKR